ncbi:MAG: PxKF domain-containing protein [Candidatus Aminicenantes bacterium]|nr:PxKF domain-containing protein [Candidatus Aminicenantes bacterium]
MLKKMKKEIIYVLMAFVLLTGLASGIFGQTTGGKIWTWGWSDQGQGLPPTDNWGFIAIDAGDYHNLGLKSDGTVIAWGANGVGQCNVPADQRFIAVSAGGYHSLGLKSDGTIVAWGWNEYGQLSVPTSNLPFIAISAGYRHNLGLTSDGTVVASGNNDFGQCEVPTDNTGFIAIAAGSTYSLGLKSDGTVVAWGLNEYGQCTVPTDNGFVAIAAGNYHSVGLKSDGTVVAWGSNFYGESIVPSPHPSSIAISAGAFHNLALEGPEFIFEGFFSPIDINSVNKAKAGQTIPIKWRITDKDGIPISDPASFVSIKSYVVDCGTFAGDPTSIVDEPATGSSGLQYLGDGWWQYNWKTAKAYQDQCRTMKLTLYDHSEHTASFSFK